MTILQSLKNGNGNSFPKIKKWTDGELVGTHCTAELHDFLLGKTTLTFSFGVATLSFQLYLTNCILHWWVYLFCWYDVYYD